MTGGERTNADAQSWLAEHGDALYRYARSKVARDDEAEDLVQETFLAALRNWPGFRGDSSLRTWLIAILRMKILDLHRRHADLPPSMLSASSEVIERNFQASGQWKTRVEAWVVPNDPVEAAEFREAVDNCLARLPKTLASVFLLREVEEMTTADLSSNLEISEANARIRLHRARLLLRECLAKSWFGGDSNDAMGA